MEAVTTRPEVTAHRAPTDLRRLWRPVAFWFASRALLWPALALANVLQANGKTLVETLRIWDGNWYLEAANGYDTAAIRPGVETGQVDVAFFPAYPLAIRAAAAVTGLPDDAAASVLNLVVGAVAVSLIWLVVQRTADADVADRAAALFCVFPGSVLLSFIYSEPLMLCFAAGCLLALLSRRWVTAGVLGALATATRPNALALVLSCAWAAVMAIRRRQEWRSLAAPLLAPLGFVAYLGWLWQRTGEPLAWFRVQREGWGEQVDFGRQTIQTVVWAFTDTEFLPPSLWVRIGGLVLIVAGLIALARWRPPMVLILYSVGIVGLSLVSLTLGARPRFVFTAFPLVAALAWAARGWGYRLMLAGSAGLCVLMAAVYAVPRFVTP